MINEVIESVAEADRRIGAVDTSVRALEDRTGQLDEIEGRIRMLGQELEQRRGALDKASEHLTQATQLRKQSAETAHRLEEVSRTITRCAHRRRGAVGQTGAHRRRARGRASALKAIERPVAHFEELLGNWESAQEEAARGLEQTLARQGAVDALEAQVKHVFELAERAVADVQTSDHRAARSRRPAICSRPRGSSSRRPKGRWRSSRPGSVSWSAPSSGWLVPKLSRSACARPSRRSPPSAPWWITRWNRPATSRCR